MQTGLPPPRRHLVKTSFFKYTLESPKESILRFTAAVCSTYMPNIEEAHEAFLDNKKCEFPWVMRVGVMWK